MTFSEGFTQGFGMVDAALYHRNANELNAQKLAKDDAHYADTLARQKAQDTQTTDWHNDDTARQGRLDTQTTDWHREDQAFKGKEFGLKEAELRNQAAYQQGSLANQRAQTGIHAAQAQSTIATNKLEREYMVAQKDREAAQLRAQNLFAYNPDTQMTMLTLTPDNEHNDLKDLQTAYGVNIGKISKDLNGFNNDLATIKTSLVDPQYFHQNKAAVLKSFNDLEGHDINTGLGKYAGTLKKHLPSN